MNSSSYLLMPEFPQMTVLNLVLGGTIFTEGGHYSPVNNVRGDIFGGDTVHYDNGKKVDNFRVWNLGSLDVDSKSGSERLKALALIQNRSNTVLVSEERVFHYQQTLDNT